MFLLGICKHDEAGRGNSKCLLSHRTFMHMLQNLHRAAFQDVEVSVEGTRDDSVGPSKRRN